MTSAFEERFMALHSDADTSPDTWSEFVSLLSETEKGMPSLEEPRAQAEEQARRSLRELQTTQFAKVVSGIASAVGKKPPPKEMFESLVGAYSGLKEDVRVSLTTDVVPELQSWVEVCLDHVMSFLATSCQKLGKEVGEQLPGWCDIFLKIAEVPEDSQTNRSASSEKYS